MRTSLPAAFRLSPEVERALEQDHPVVALESTVLTHGLPYPSNLNLAEDMEDELRSQGVVPATIAVMDGDVHVGLTPAQLLGLLRPGRELRKVSIRDFGAAIANRASGGTTVAGTMLAASLSGIRVFATGGIGGVHHNTNRRRNPTMDISADLPALASIPMIVVCTGAKAILDLPATVEYLETWGVPVVGYQTEYFPAFYSLSSGLKVSVRAENAAEVVEIALAHWSLGMKSAILVTVPPPIEAALSIEEVNLAVRQALKDAIAEDIQGQDVTPFLLERVRRHTRGESLQANLALLLNNARVAAQIARWI